MKKKIDFLLCYEHKNREYESLVLLKHELEKRGYTVMYRCLYENSVLNYPQFKNIKPRCVIVPAAYDEKILECFCFNIVGYIGKIINLQWEQILTVEEEYDINAYHNPKGMAKNVVHLCWGNKTKERLIRAGVEDNNIFVTGPIHLDALRLENRRCLFSKKELAQKYKLDINKKWILFISSFGFCDLDERMKSYIISCYGDDYVNYFIDYSIKSRQKILEWLKQLVNDNNSYQVIYRPHPDEIKVDNELVEIQKFVKNFFIIKDLPIKHWIYSSDIVLNWFSTSKADSVFLGKPDIVLRPYKIRDKDEVSIMKGEKFCTTYDDLKSSIDNYQNKEINSSIYEYYDVNEKIPSYVRVADICEQVLLDKKIKISFSLSKYVLYFCKVFKYWVFGVIRGLFPSFFLVQRFEKHFREADEFLRAGEESNIGTKIEENEILVRYYGDLQSNE